MTYRSQKRKIWNQKRANQSVATKGVILCHCVTLKTLTWEGNQRVVTKTFFPQNLRMVLWACLCEGVRVGIGVTTISVIHWNMKTKGYIGRLGFERGWNFLVTCWCICGYRAVTMHAPTNPILLLVLEALPTILPSKIACVYSQKEPECWVYKE